MAMNLTSHSYLRTRCTVSSTHVSVHAYVYVCVCTRCTCGFWTDLSSSLTFLCALGRIPRCGVWHSHVMRLCSFYRCVGGETDCRQICVAIAWQIGSRFSVPFLRDLASWFCGDIKASWCFEVIARSFTTHEVSRCFDQDE